jgi:hypothetical protein
MTIRKFSEWNRFTAIAILLLCSTVLPQYSEGQTSAINGQIQGTLTDPAGAALIGATVEVLNLDNGFKRSVQTDETGYYKFNVLPLGKYEVSATAGGFAPTKRKGVEINAGTSATVDLKLSVSGVVAEISVTDVPQGVETERTDLGSTLSSNQVQNLPLVSRNTYNFILAQPNVSGHPNPEFGVPRKVNANGFADRINYQLDGNNNTQSDRAGIRLLPISNTFVQEVQQVNNGFAAEFGNTTGTVFNAVTKSGSNNVHGEGAYIFRRTDFNARPTLLATTAAKPQLSLDSYIADVGGPVVKDKLFFFGAFEHDKRDLPSPVTATAATLAGVGLPAAAGEAVPFSQNLYFLMGKMDYQINTANRFSLRYSYVRNNSPYNSAGGLTLASQSYNFVDRAHSFASQLVSVVSKNAVNEFRFQFPLRNQRQLTFEATGPQPAITISGLVNFGGSTGTGFQFVESTPEWADNFSYNMGSHSLKFGGDFRLIKDKQSQAQFAQYTFPSIAAYQAAVSGTNTKSYSTFAQTLGNPRIEYSSLFTGIYAQDTWRVRPNVTVSYGLRYDLYKIPSADPTSLFPASQNFTIDKNNFAPRLGIAYSPNSKTVVRLNAGIFYDAPMTNVYELAIQNNGSPSFFTMSAAPSSPFAPAFPNIFTTVPTGFSLPTQDVTTVSPNFRTMYSSNVNLQVSREVAKNLSIDASYMFTKGTGIPVYRNVNIVPTATTLADGRPIYGTGRVFPKFNNIIQAESVGNSNYSGMNLTLKRHMNRGYEWFVSYTYSHAIDDAPERNVLDSGANMPEDASNRGRDRANSLTDRRHALTFTGVLNPQFSLKSDVLNAVLNNNMLSLMFTGGSGDVFNMGSNVVLNGDTMVPSAQQRPLFVGRNSLPGPNIYQMDMRYTRSIPLREGIKAQFLIEASNVFNHSNITAISSTAVVSTGTGVGVNAAPRGTILTPATLAPSTALDSRLMQMGFRVTF